MREFSKNARVSRVMYETWQLACLRQLSWVHHDKDKQLKQ